MSTDREDVARDLGLAGHRVPVHIDPVLAALLADQDGLVARRQVLDPATLARVDRRLAARRWLAPYSGVYVSHTGPLTLVQKRWAALLACGHGAALTGVTVLESAGVNGVSSARVHVAVPHPRRGPGASGVQISRVAGLERFVHPAARPPQVRLEYATLAAASAARTEGQAHAFLTAVVQQNRLTVDHLRDQLSLLPRLPRRAMIAESLLDITDGAQSLNEIALLRVFGRAGLPRPMLQVQVATPHRRAYIDGGWPDLGVWFEVDGELHRQAAQWADDLDRANELAIEQGGTRLRWSGFVVRRQPDRVADQASRALRQAGWAAPGVILVPTSAAFRGLGDPKRRGG